MSHTASGPEGNAMDSMGASKSKGLVGSAASKQGKTYACAAGAVVLVFFLILPNFTSNYIITLLLVMFVYIGYAVSWNLMSGLTGYVNFGFSLFVGVASYASVLSIVDLNMWWPRGPGSSAVCPHPLWPAPWARSC